MRRRGFGGGAVAVAYFHGTSEQRGCSSVLQLLPRTRLQLCCEKVNFEILDFNFEVLMLNLGQIPFGRSDFNFLGVRTHFRKHCFGSGPIFGSIFFIFFGSEAFFGSIFFFGTFFRKHFFLGQNPFRKHFFWKKTLFWPRAEFLRPRGRFPGARGGLWGPINDFGSWPRNFAF